MRRSGHKGSLHPPPRTHKTIPVEELLQDRTHDEAIQLAQDQGYADADIAELHRLCGDRLYAKGEFDPAMQQYIKTIGFVQASYVIRKYLDTQRTPALTEYLQELHNHRLASSDLTTLLLNCYAKLKDVKRLDEFIKTSVTKSTSVSSDVVERELPFNLETAINVCRQSGYHDHAVYLAQKYRQHEQYLVIQLEDREDWDNALNYIRTLDLPTAEENLVRYGKTLLDHEPQKTTDVIIDICCGTLHRLDSQQEQNGNTNDSAGVTSYLSYLSYPKRNLSSAQLETTEEKAERPTRVEREGNVTGQPTEHPNATLTDVQDAGVNGSATANNYSLPSPRTFFPFFINETSRFITFLEVVASRRWSQEISNDIPLKEGELSEAATNFPKDDKEIDEGSDNDENLDQKAVWNTLLELYLSTATDSPSTSKPNTDTLEDLKPMEAKALRILQNSERFPFDCFQALMICTNVSFTPGILLLYERLGRIDDILRFWMEKSKSASGDERYTCSTNVIRALHRFGPADRPSLYPMVMRFMASSSDLLSKHLEDIKQILDYIEKNHVLPQVTVLQALAQTDAATIGLVRDYLMRQINLQREQTKSDRALIDSYRQETARRQKEIEELEDPESPIIFQVTRCSTCGQQIDLPKVYFQCKHCFHQRCLGNEQKCPLCSRQRDMIREIMAANKSSLENPDLFMAEVEESDDKYGSAVAAFSKGVMNNANGIRP